MLASQRRRKDRVVSMTASQSGKTSIGGAASCGEFGEAGTNGVFHCRNEIKRGALFEKGRNRVDEASHVG